MTTLKLFIPSAISLILATSAFCSNNELPGDEAQADLPKSRAPLEVLSKELEETKARTEETKTKVEEARARSAALLAQVEALKAENKEKTQQLRKKTATVKWSALNNMKVRNRVVKFINEGREILPKDLAFILGRPTKDAAYADLEKYLYEVIREELNPSSNDKRSLSRLLADCNKSFDAIAKTPQFNGILTEYSRHGILPLLIRNLINQSDGDVKEKLTEHFKCLMDQRIQELRKTEKKPALTREQQAQLIKANIIEMRNGRIRKQFNELSVIKPDNLSQQIGEIKDEHAREVLKGMLHEITEILRQVRLADERFQESFAREDLDTKFQSIGPYENRLQEQLELITKKYQDLVLGIAKSISKPVVDSSRPVELKSSKRIKAPKGKLKRTESMESIPEAISAVSTSSEEEEEIKPITFKAGNEAATIFAEAQEGNKTFELLKILQESRGNLFKLIKRLSAYPGSDLHELNFDRKGQYSIKINRGDRICFSKGDGMFADVEIVNYH